MRPEQRVEPAHALETAGERHLDDGHVDLGEKLLGQEQPLGLGQLDGRDAELLPDGAAELPRAQSQVFGQQFQAAAVVQRARLDPARGRSRRSLDRVDRRMARGQLGPTPQARPEPVPLGEGRVREEPATSRPGVLAVQIGRQ